MRAIQVKCPNCAAVLRVEGAEEAVRCEYCGARSVVQRRTMWKRAPQKADPGVAHEVSGKRLGLVITAVCLAVTGVIVWFVLAKVNAAFDAVPGGDRARAAAASALGFGDDEGAPMRWLGLGPAILSDVDGDGTVDALGRVRYTSPDDACHVAAFSGATGERLWQSAALGSYSDTYRGRLWLAGELLLFAHPDGQLDAFGAGDGEPRWRVSLPDEATGACADGDAAVVFELADESARRVALADGAARRVDAPADCQALPGDYQDAPDPAIEVVEVRRRELSGMRAARILRREGGPEVAVGSRDPGTAVPMLARLDDGGEPLWTVQVPAEKPLDAQTGAPELATLGPGQVCAVYEPDSSASRLTCFELDGGNRQWDAAVAQGTTIVARGLSWGSGRLFLSSWGHLQIYEADSGRRLHVIGTL